MPEEFASPEEKLLRLIRGERKPKNKTLPLPDKEKAAPHEGDSKVPAIAPRHKIAPAVQLKAGGEYVKIINITLITVIVIIAAVLLIDIISFNLKRTSYLSEATRETAGRPEPQTRPEVPSRDNASSPVTKNLDDSGFLASKDLFKTSPVQAAPVAGAPQASYNKLKDYTLKGIIAGDKPQVILEDEKNNKSYFLYKGDSVDNIKVEDIQPGKVILSINGEVLELTL
jgi:type II secretory pathway component PulC